MTDLTREELDLHLDRAPIYTAITGWIVHNAPPELNAQLPPALVESLTDAILARLPPVEQIRAEARREALEEAAKACDAIADANAYSAAPIIAGVHDGCRKAARAIRALTSHTPKEEKAVDVTDPRKEGFDAGQKRAFKLAAKELRLSASHGGEGASLERAWAEQFENHSGIDHHPEVFPTLPNDAQEK